MGVTRRENKKQMGFALCNQRLMVTNCELVTKTDIGRDYRLVRMISRMNERLARLKTTTKQTPFNTNTQKLKTRKRDLNNLKTTTKKQKHVKNSRRYQLVI